MTVSILRKNIDAIRKHDHQLAERLEKVCPSPRISRVVDSSGKVTFEVTGPDAEGKLKIPDIGGPMLDSVAGEFSSARMVVALGFGSGRMLSEIADRTSGQTFILLVEPDIDLFSSVIGEVDLSRIFSLERVCAAVGEKPQAATIIRAENEFSVFTLRDFPTIENPWSAPVYRSYFTEVKKNLDQLKEFGRQNTITLASMGKEWRKNIFENLPTIINSPPVSSLFDKYTGSPAVVVAAGPSLDKNKSALASVKGRFLIISVDTAIGPLLSAGVAPDIVVAIDSQYENYLHVAGYDQPGTLFALSPIVWPELARERAGGSVFIGNNEPMFEWIEDIIGKRGDVKAGGSVATTAFDLAVKLGCSPIIFVGQDMAYTNDKSHATGSLQDMTGQVAPMEMAHQDKEAGNSLFSKKDIFGRPALTSIKMDTWRRWYEVIISHDGVTALNATEGGIEIPGVASVSLVEAIATNMKNALPLSQIAYERSEWPEKTGDLEKALAGARKEARSVKTVCARGSQQLQTAMGRAGYEGMAATRTMTDMQVLGGLAHEILEHELFVEVNRWSVDMVIDSLERLRKNGADITQAESLANLFEAYSALFRELYEIASEFDKGSTKALEEIERMTLVGNGA